MWPGKSSPRGALWTGDGVNFALFTETAERVELCLFDEPASGAASQVVPLTHKTRHTWHCFLPHCRPGQLYAYRVHGPYDPGRGKRFNPAKLLLDPYARAITGKVDWSRGSALAYDPFRPELDWVRDPRDNAAAMPKCVVVDPAFDWDGDRHPATPLHRSILYEVHVKGFTQTFPGLDPALRGTYAGLVAPDVLNYLVRLGITAVELLPIHESQPEKFLLDRGLTNYWGYNSMGFFAPDGRYSSSGTRGQQVNEFKQMVKRLHRAGIEVILDVVYNHTAETDHRGPTLSWRGIDNESYYWLVPGDPYHYMDFTGCGNSPRMSHPDVLQMVMDSLRYWVQEMHVDGFRFDLASTLAREEDGVSKLSGFFDILHQDPVLNTVKLIAEPWDIRAGGYQVGNFPVDWSEWNAKYRDTVRSFWRGDAGQVPDMAYRLTGSSDLYSEDGRTPAASINFITCHDGFTLADLVSYNQKHNEANLEENRDGNDHNLSWNCGVEGPTNDAAVQSLRARQMRNFLATLLLSQGTPMLMSGDELGRTQLGNNNAYCQDNELSWMNWHQQKEQSALLEFVRRLVHFRRQHPAFQRHIFFAGRGDGLDQLKDITWVRPDGSEMTHDDWFVGYAHSLAFVIDGRDLEEVDAHGAPIKDALFLIIVNGDDKPLTYRLPCLKGCWLLHMDTARGWTKPKCYPACEDYTIESRCVALLELIPEKNFTVKRGDSLI